MKTFKAKLFAVEIEQTNNQYRIGNKRNLLLFERTLSAIHWRKNEGNNFLYCLDTNIQFRRVALMEGSINKNSAKVASELQEFLHLKLLSMTWLRKGKEHFVNTAWRLYKEIFCIFIAVVTVLGDFKQTQYIYDMYER